MSAEYKHTVYAVGVKFDAAQLRLMTENVMKKLRCPKKEFIAIQGWDICTKRGTILCDEGFSNPRWAKPDAGPHPGSNGDGHKLPSSGGERP